MGDSCGFSLFAGPPCPKEAVARQIKSAHPHPLPLCYLHVSGRGCCSTLTVARLRLHRRVGGLKWCRRASHGHGQRCRRWRIWVCRLDDVMLLGRVACAIFWLQRLAPQGTDMHLSPGAARQAQLAASVRACATGLGVGCQRHVTEGSGPGKCGAFRPSDSIHPDRLRSFAGLLQRRNM